MQKNDDKENTWQSAGGGKGGWEKSGLHGMLEMELDIHSYWGPRLD
jgi:hypothetical protein